MTPENLFQENLEKRLKQASKDGLLPLELDHDTFIRLFDDPANPLCDCDKNDRQ